MGLIGDLERREDLDVAAAGYGRWGYVLEDVRVGLLADALDLSHG